MTGQKRFRFSRRVTRLAEGITFTWQGRKERVETELSPEVGLEGQLTATKLGMACALYFSCHEPRGLRGSTSLIPLCLQVKAFSEGREEVIPPETRSFSQVWDKLKDGEYGTGGTRVPTVLSSVLMQLVLSPPNTTTLAGM